MWVLTNITQKMQHTRQKAGLLLLFSHQVVCNALGPHGLQHTSLPVPHYLLEFSQEKGWCLKEIRQRQNIAHFSQRNWVDIGNVHARHTHFLLDHCTLCHELYQNYSGEVCDKLETFDEFSVVIVVNYALHSKPHHWLQALHVTQPGDLGWFHMGAAW